MQTTEATRIRQGASATTSPDLLRELANDLSVTVRASLALNPALPAQVSEILATDTDARVRTIISRKRAVPMPAPSDESRRHGQQDAVAKLTAMIAEAALRMRVNVAEAVKDMPEGPAEIILRLAHDPAAMVCEPVIRFSPMLTQEDLVTLIASGPPPSTIVAVARRTNIVATVSDAIVGTADVAAIGALLADHSAQIRDATLDALSAQSEECTDWQAPLVRRPQLPARAHRMLAEIVTGDLLATLAARGKPDSQVGQTLSASMTRIQPVSPAQSWVEPSANREVQAALGRAQALNEAGKLDDHVVLDVLRSNAIVEASVMLATKANVPVSVIERARDLHSAKAIISLAWKAGLSPQTSVTLQAVLGGVTPDQILRPGERGDFPLSAEEMRRQLASLGVGEDLRRAWTPRRPA